MRTQVFHVNLSAIVKVLKSAFSIWKSNDAEIEELVVWCKTHILLHAHSTHGVEASVREASHCAAVLQRSEEVQSVCALQ